jgi:hypothetical protein
MLGSVEMAHAGVRFCPDDQIERRQPQSGCRRVNDRQAAPIDECAKQSSIHEIRKDGINPCLMKFQDLCAGHFAGGRCEFPRFASSHFPAYCDREGRIRENKSRDIMRHEPSDDSRTGRIAQDDSRAGRDWPSGHSGWLSARLLYVDCVEDLGFRITHYLETGSSSGRYSKCIVS